MYNLTFIKNNHAFRIVGWLSRVVENLKLYDLFYEGLFIGLF